MSTPTGRQHAVDVIAAQLRNARAAAKCHACGCLHGALAALAGTAPGRETLAGLLEEVGTVLKPKAYDCLGCDVCYPALASNAFAAAFPDAADVAAACPTDAPGERGGWPPLPGDYHVVRSGAPVAVCTLNSDGLAARLARQAPEGLAIAGTLRTENLGVERVVVNVLGNPRLRFLVLCGEDTRQAVGHLPGQSLESLFAHGLDERGRIAGARGKRPILSNVSAEQVTRFLRQVELVSLIGEERDEAIRQAIADLAARDPGPLDGAPQPVGVPVVQGREPDRLVPDPAGFVVVYPDARRRRLVVEHYSNAGVLDCVVEGADAAGIYSEIIARALITRLDHAAYLGRELALAERCLRTGERYVQDRAPGELQEFVEAGGGATFVGDESPNAGVASAGAEQLVKRKI